MECWLSFSRSHWSIFSGVRQKGLSEQFLVAQQAFRTILGDIGGFLNAATSSLQGFLAGFLEEVSDFKRACRIFY
jgi:hypothetical protein